MLTSSLRYMLLARPARLFYRSALGLPLIKSGEFRIAVSQCRAVVCNRNLAQTPHCAASTNSTSIDMPKRKRQAGGRVHAGSTAMLEPPLPEQRQMSSTTQESLTATRFDSLALSTETKRALEVMHYTNCTTVQAASLPVCLTGVDVVCKAKTGTGKTLAFLIPAVERMKQQPKPARGLVSILVISPTRELTYQIAKEAEQLTRSHNLIAKAVVGGTNVKSDMRMLETNSPHILVATPGRLLDLLETSNLAQQLRQLQCLIFDEGDRLMDMGFKPTIDKIVAKLPPKEKRQTVLFSATFPSDIQALARKALRPNNKIVDTVGESEVQTAEKVLQEVVLSPMDDLSANMLAIIRQHVKEEPNFKVETVTSLTIQESDLSLSNMTDYITSSYLNIIAFFTTAMLTAFYAELFKRMDLPILEIHSRKSQSARTKTSDTFRKLSRQILFSSDVSARGVDYPDVTLVLQVGCPSEKDQYIHRVGRTGRAGKLGKSVLILQDFEKFFLRSLKGLPVKEIQPLSPEEKSRTRSELQQALSTLSHSTSAKAYQSWLGYYTPQKKYIGWSLEEVVQNANYFATTALGLETPPPLLKKTIGMMGLKGVPGLNVERANPLEKSRPQGGRGRQSY